MTRFYLVILAFIVMSLLTAKDITAKVEKTKPAVKAPTDMIGGMPVTVNAAMTRGPEKAPVQIYEFSSYQ